MRFITRCLMAIILMAMVGTTLATAQEYPQPTGYVNDYAQLLSRTDGQKLNDELVAFEHQTSIEISVVTIPSLGGVPIEEYTRGLATAWGVGKAGQNNGVVLLIAPTERKMRIEVASGVHDILTDARADQIRDDVIIPPLKRGDWATGIIDGTRAIMTALTPTAAGPTTENNPPREPVNQLGWTSQDTATAMIYFGSIVLLIAMFAVARYVMRRRAARMFVLDSKEDMAKRIAEAESLADNADVTMETRLLMAPLRTIFRPINLLTALDTKTPWVDVKRKMEELDYRLRDLIRKMKREIDFAEEARREAPKLMEQLPGLIAAAEQKLADGKSSRDAVKHLAQAREFYAQAQRGHSGNDLINWVILYLLLENAQSSVARAESSHTYANTEHHSSSHHSDNSPSSSGGDYGFGSSSGGGFGGGGGFDSGSGGGGSTGSF